MKRPNNSGAYANNAGPQNRRNTRLCTHRGPWCRPANIASRIAAHPTSFLIPFIIYAGLAGCSFLKPAPDTSRHFVLTPLPAAEAANVARGTSAVGVGVVHVKIPTYLSNSSLAVRKGANEIDYPPATLWAERLGAGIPRVLTADLSSLLPGEQIRSSVVPGDNVAKEIGVTFEQFDVSSSGHAVLVAQWRILAPGGEKVLRSGETRLSRDGPSPDTNPSGAVGTLSELIADLSRQLAQAFNEA